MHTTTQNIATSVFLLLVLLVAQSPAAEVADNPLAIIETIDTIMPTDTKTNPSYDPHSAIYRPPQVPLDVAGYPSPPDGLELEQVHIYVRHGERTPVGVRLAGPPASIPENWEMCKTSRRFLGTTSFATGEDALDLKGGHHPYYTRRVVERKDGKAGGADCLLGELTDLGRATTYHFGKNIRRLYIDRLGFLPDELDDERLVYLRSTNMPRTMESLQQIVHGLYPQSKCGSGVMPTVLLRNGKDENLIGNTYTCKRLEFLQIGFANAAAARYNPELEQLDAKVSKYLDGGPIRVDGKPRASGVMDTIRAAIAHGVKVPSEFEDPKIVDLIETSVVNEWFADKTEEVRRLGMGRLLDDLTRKMGHKIRRGDKDPLKLLVHSTHDTAIAALCSTFDVFDEKWPAFTASITFELFKRTPNPSQQPSMSQSVMSTLGLSSSPEYFVRMRHQNKDLHLPICASPGKHLEGHPEFCTFNAFKERVQELTPADWEAECSMKQK